MRKVKALEIFAAAIAAVPVVAFADEYAVPTQGSAGQKQQVNIIDAVSGRFSLLPTSLANGGPEADVDAIWDNGGASTSWHDAPNWTTEPAIPDGPNAIARFTGASGGAVPTLGTNTVTLNKLFYNDGQLSGIIGGQLNFANTGEVNVTQSNSELTPRGSLVLADLGTGNNTIGGAGTFQTVIGGNVGLTKTGPGPLELGNANTFTGAVNINGGRLLTTAGDAAFGNSANQININNGATLFVTAADMDTSRTINIGAGGGSITYFDAGRQFISRGNITGSSTLTINGIFGTSAATFTTAKSFSGLVHLKDGSLTLADTGAIASASGIRNDGTLVVNGGANRIGDATPISMRGSVYRQNGGSETVGPVTLEGSTSWFAAENNGAINMASLNRGAQRGDVSFRGLNLGTGGTTITFANGPALLKGGIIPFAYGNAGPTGNLVLQPETEQNTLVTYGANGVTPITNYHSDINTSTASDNVLIGDAGASLTGNRFANALVLRVSDFYLAPPMEVTGNGTVNLTTGVVLNAHAGFDANGNINSTPGNIIRPGVNINAGTNELIIMAPSALRIEGALHGSGGLTKNGGRTVNFAGNQSTYTGVTNLSGFIRFDDSVPSGAPSPFGSSTTAINMYAGNFNPQNVTGAAANGTMDAVLAIDDAGVGNIVFDRGINSHGPGTTFIRNFGNSTFTIDGPITVNPGSLLNFHGFGGFPNEKFVVNGAISGSGDLYAQDRNGATVSQTYELILNGNNSWFTGDFYTHGHIVAGNDTGLGSWLVVAPFPTYLESRNGPRTFANDFRVLGGLGSAGNPPITLTGEIFGQVGAYTADVNGSATMTWAGTLSGGGFFKSGPGTLVISGNNTGFGGPINVGNGSIEGNFVILASNTAVGDVGGITAANFGNNTVLLAPRSEERRVGKE